MVIIASLMNARNLKIVSKSLYFNKKEMIKEKERKEKEKKQSRIMVDNEVLK